MPVANLVRNCAYYWGFAAFVSYFVNHPLYTAPAPMQSCVALGAALLCQAANYWCVCVCVGITQHVSVCNSMNGIRRF